ncbi:uncharacterized protein [Spinacia oleracea]|uniref:Uncharacterized protein n=1 Tax=Spinacia oleracea TaxID=3562 RepID=A0ABM3QGB3_SPIOL|nr:uncharacterized protein LOC110792028 [Spinacia oleracea]XP_056682395.1 uncharacterized protein LOC110792028 [Spinacia oleracea]XP_056682396.1 uncharacterized protein LOC110792028 [Spinacia oleracea]XP_056682397.1 uncharacterized protein LOC110792028 [Spinacia oleracea]XP_056682398.1 uncharacterized protein LOC110792028 [Spinacia oleracea]XP_056682399.1 uncharacterized protein LOC110792028 [Spinacia oleracea]XP_056682400.1 uncharacterized protein LOC110792028 [Spinacia oleracea]XP_05668240
MLQDMHTIGPKSYALLRHKLQQEDPNKQEPSQAKVYKASRSRNPKKTYKTSFEKTKDNIVQMEALVSQQQEVGQKNADPYYEVIKKAEHIGRVRLFGKAVTKSDLKKRGKASGYTIPEEFLQSIQAMLIKQFQEANPGMNLVVPGSSTGSIPRESTSDRSQVNEERSGEQSSTGTQLENQVVEEQMN